MKSKFHEPFQLTAPATKALSARFPKREMLQSHRRDKERNLPKSTGAHESALGSQPQYSKLR